MVSVADVDVVKEGDVRVFAVDCTVVEAPVSVSVVGKTCECYCYCYSFLVKTIAHTAKHILALSC